MNWYRILVNEGGERCKTFAGSSAASLEALIEKASCGEYLRLDNLVYQDRGAINLGVALYGLLTGRMKDSSEPDNREAPIICINPAQVVAIQPFTGDPRTRSS
jgi:hypothetical protein